MRFADFRVWLETELEDSEEEYDRRHRDLFDTAWARNKKPFGDWFPKGENRLYIAFEVDGDEDMPFSYHTPGGIERRKVKVPALRNSIDLLLERQGYKLHDFVKGLATKPNDKRHYRLVPILDAIKEGLSEDSKKYVEILKQDFIHCRLRLNEGTNPFLIAISQDPHDIAKMTYGRTWKMGSCMRLPSDDNPEGGGKHKELTDEVEEGGLVAYLIKPEDKDIKQPLARAWIRRFEKDNKSLAICEDSTYGVQISNFVPEIAKFLKTKQHGRHWGKWRKKGAKWSDTLETNKMILPNESEFTKENEPHLLELMKTVEGYENKAQMALLYTVIMRKEWHHPNTFSEEFIRKTIATMVDAARYGVSWHDDTAPALATPVVAARLGIRYKEISSLFNYLNINALVRYTNNLSSTPPIIQGYLVPAIIDAIKRDRVIRSFSIGSMIAPMQKVSVLTDELLANITPEEAMEGLRYINPQVGDWYEIREKLEQRAHEPSEDGTVHIVRLAKEVRPFDKCRFGDCKSTCVDLKRKLPGATLVGGQFICSPDLEFDHSWLEYQGYILDPTVDMFFSDLDVDMETRTYGIYYSHPDWDGDTLKNRYKKTP